MIDRREFLGIAAGASLALTPQSLHALQQSGGKLIQRAIPSTGEMLPVSGLSFSNHPACADHAALRVPAPSQASGGKDQRNTEWPQWRGPAAFAR